MSIIFLVDQESFKLIAGPNTNAVYLHETVDALTYYVVDGTAIFKTVYPIVFDEEGIPLTQDTLMFKQSFFTNAIVVQGAKEDTVVRMVVSQGE